MAFYYTWSSLTKVHSRASEGRKRGLLSKYKRRLCFLNTNLKYYLYFCVAANTRKMISWPILPNLTSKCKSSVSKYLFKIIWSSFLVQVISFLAALFKCRQQYNIVKYIANTGKCADKKKGGLPSKYKGSSCLLNTKLKYYLYFGVPAGSES